MVFFESVRRTGIRAFQFDVIYLNRLRRRQLTALKVAINLRNAAALI
jgi:hypothetical protein